MTPSFQEIKDASFSLTASQRAELAHDLLQSLETEEELWTESWREELSRRLEDFRSGKVVSVPAEEVIERLREKYP